MLSVAFGPVVRFDLEGYAATVDTRLAVANAVLSAGLGAAYFVGSYVLLRATPGHRVLAMTLVRAGERERERVSLSSAVLRWLLLAAPFGAASVAMTAMEGAWDAVAALAAAVWYVVLLVTTATHPAKQGLHDRIAGTTMVKAARLAGPRAPVAGE